MFRIYISYREEDSEGYAAWIYKRLCDHFGSHQIFRDIESIPAGENKDNFKKEAAFACDVMIVVIGNEWITTTDEHGRLKLRKASDKVRREISLALKNKKRVIPVLINRTPLPGKEVLPESLDSLAELKPIYISEHDIDHNINQLIEILEAQIQSTPGRYAVYERVQPQATTIPGKKISFSVTILIISIGWAFGWEILNELILNTRGVFSGILQSPFISLPNPINFIVGGIFAGMIIGASLGFGLRRFLQASNWKFIIFISLGWMIVLPLGLYMSQINISFEPTIVIFSIFLGGVVTGLSIRNVEKRFQWWQVLIVGVVVMLCFSIVGFRSFIIFGTPSNPSYFEWLIASTIGGGLILWQIRHAQEK